MSWSEITSDIPQTGEQDASKQKRRGPENPGLDLAKTGKINIVRDRHRHRRCIRDDRRHRRRGRALRAAWQR